MSANFPNPVSQSTLHLSALDLGGYEYTTVIEVWGKLVILLAHGRSHDRKVKDVANSITMVAQLPGIA